MGPIPLRVLLAASLLLPLTLPAWPQTAGTPGQSAELVFWQSVRDSSDPRELEAYLKAYPQGQFAPLATLRLQKLRAEESGKSASTPDPSPPAQNSQPSQDPPRADIPGPPPAKLRGWIGLEVRSVDDTRARELALPAAAGAEVIALIDYGPGARSGLKPRDVIVSLDGTAVTDHAHLVRLTGARRPADSVALVIVRGGKRETLAMTIGNFFNDQWDAAHRGNAVAMRSLGFEYYAGNLIAKDLPKAVNWNRKAAAAGDTIAMMNLGRFYQGGDGVERSDAEALRWYRQAAEAGNADAMFSVGLLHYRGQGVERDLPEAARWYRRAIEKDHPAAMHNYATLLQDGAGVEKNETLALDYFRRAAKLGQPESFASLGLAYFNGLGVKKDHTQAERWYREAANRNVSLGFTGLGMLYEQGHVDLAKDRAAAIKYYRKGAEAGDTYALERLKALKATVYDPQEIQKLLTDLGFNARGRQLTPAIHAFQKSRGLPVNGDMSLRLVGQLRDALKQKTAVADPKTAEPPQDRAAADPDLGNLKDLEKLDALQ